MRRKMFSIMCGFIMLMNCNPIGVVFAESMEPEQSVQNVVSEENEKTTGLIYGYALSISAGSSSVYLTARTTATDIMAKVGFTDISIQRSVNGTSGWTEEKSLADDLAENAVYHKKTNEYVSVAGGYYYRVVLDHYAKETGWFFPGHESITNYSNVVWVPAY